MAADPRMTAHVPATAYERDSALVRQALAAAGIDPAGFGVFVNRAVPGVTAPARFDSQAAVPVLLELLPRVSDERVREAMVRHLKTSAAKRIAADELIAEFSKASGMLYKWTVADVLVFVADRRRYSDLVELAADPRHGMARQMLVGMLGRVKTARADEVLLGSLTDPEVAGHAMSAARRRFVSTEARRLLEPLAAHADARVREAASQQLRRIGREESRQSRSA